MIRASAADSFLFLGGHIRFLSVVLSLAFISLPAIAGEMATLNNGFCDEKPVDDCHHSKFKISVIDQAQADRLFHQFKELPEMAAGYNADGCYARAHKMAKAAEGQGIIVGKIFIEGILRPKPNAPKVPPLESSKGMLGNMDTFWAWHVADVIYVKDKKGKSVPLVFDPVVGAKPMTVDEFKKQLLYPGKPEPRINDVYFSSRYQYAVRQKSAIAQNSWSDMDVMNSEQTLGMYEAYMKNLGIAKGLPWVPADGALSVPPANPFRMMNHGLNPYGDMNAWPPASKDVGAGQ